MSRANQITKQDAAEASSAGSEATIISNNGTVAAFSNGDRYPRTFLPTLFQNINRNMLSEDQFKQVFAVDSTLAEAKERLKNPPSPDETPKQPLRMSTNSVGATDLMEKVKERGGISEQPSPKLSEAS